MLLQVFLKKLRPLELYGREESEHCLFNLIYGNRFFVIQMVKLRNVWWEPSCTVLLVRQPEIWGSIERDEESILGFAL